MSARAEPSIYEGPALCLPGLEGLVIVPQVLHGLASSAPEPGDDEATLLVEPAAFLLPVRLVLADERGVRTLPLWPRPASGEALAPPGPLPRAARDALVARALRVEDGALIACRLEQDDDGGWAERARQRVDAAMLRG